MNFTETREDFATRQNEIQKKDEGYLIGPVRYALRALMRGKDEWFEPLLRRVEQVARTAYRREADSITSDILRSAIAEMRASLRKSLRLTSVPDKDGLEARAQALAKSLSSLANAIGVEAAAMADGEMIGLEWATLHGEGGDDGRVRAAHLAADGQVRLPGQKYDVGGVKMSRPGDPTAPPELWINCRCALRPVPMERQSVTATTNTGGEMTTPVTEFVEGDQVDLDEDNIDDIDEEFEISEMVPWHGVLAPEDVVSGDGRKFGLEALTWRDLPLPLRWQKEDWGGHDGAVTVGRIDNIYREVDADGVTLVWGEGAMLSIPEADEAVGMMAEGGLRGVSVDVDKATMRLEDEDGNEITMDSVLELGEDTVILTVFPEGRISGATLCAIPAFMEAYVALGERPRFTDEDAMEEKELTDGYNSGTEEFVKTEDGPGWLTHPVDTDRLRRYWTKGPGAAKIRWGVPGDFNRCREQLAKYVKPQYLSGYCANRHYDALGFWPGRPVSAETVNFAISEKPWDGSASRFTIEEWRRSTLIDTGEGDPDSKSRYKLPIREPNGDLSRAGVHAAAGRINQTQAPDAQISKAKASLRSAYKQLGEDAPDTLALVAAPALYLVASGEKWRPAREWFDDPGLTEPTRFSWTEEGHVFGHVAQWGVCHIGISGVCTEPPSSASGYAHFGYGTVETTDGLVHNVGQITMDCGHADLNMSARAAAAHYDNLGTAVCDIVCGEDDIGIWFSGAMRPWIPEEKKYALRASGKLSGDWREIDGSLEMVATLAVNVNGFPIIPLGLAASGGHQTALIAAGLIPDSPKKTLDVIVREAVRGELAMIERRKRMADLKVRAGLDPRSRLAALAERK